MGLKRFTPYDLCRTAAILAGDLGFDDAWIAKCLDHSASKKSEQIVPTVTAAPGRLGSCARRRSRRQVKREPRQSIRLSGS
ncbi:hypothetical protein BJS_01438 [Bradyrhizobium japonicum SEMIA 5079]|nr:hypothetical protein BJS_01438 [Bradyrhizobium japonicum SEMIA 5079]